MKLPTYVFDYLAELAVLLDDDRYFRLPFVG